MRHEVELLWFDGCANHPAARSMLEEVIAELAPGTPIHDVDATDTAVADRLRFPGSPTIRVDGVDVDPTYVDPSDYTPRCRLYRTSAGLRGLPERGWIETALRSDPQRLRRRALRRLAGRRYATEPEDDACALERRRQSKEITGQ